MLWLRLTLTPGFMTFITSIIVGQDDTQHHDTRDTYQDYQHLVKLYPPQWTEKIKAGPEKFLWKFFLQFSNPPSQDICWIFSEDWRDVFDNDIDSLIVKSVWVYFTSALYAGGEITILILSGPLTTQLATHTILKLVTWDAKWKSPSDKLRVQAVMLQRLFIDNPGTFENIWMGRTFFVLILERNQDLVLRHVYLSVHNDLILRPFVSPILSILCSPWILCSSR